MGGGGECGIRVDAVIIDQSPYGGSRNMTRMLGFRWLKTSHLIGWLAARSFGLVSGSLRGFVLHRHRRAPVVLVWKYKVSWKVKVSSKSHKRIIVSDIYKSWDVYLILCLFVLVERLCPLELWRSSSVPRATSVDLTTTCSLCKMLVYMCSG